jgi:hypothetical protein
MQDQGLHQDEKFHDIGGLLQRQEAWKGGRVGGDGAAPIPGEAEVMTNFD